MQPNYEAAAPLAPRNLAFGEPERCFLLEQALSPDECDTVVARAERRGFLATGLDYPPSYRDNDRAVLDDPSLASRLFARIARHLPRTLLVRGEVFELAAANPRFRLCRYRGGQSFRVHQDGAFEPSTTERSLLTCQFSLSHPRDFHGGHTRFYAGRRGPLLGTVKPPRGSALVFAHDFWHDGERVDDGTKIVLRMDIVYARRGSPRVEATDHLVRTVARHTGYVFAAIPLLGGRIASGGRDRLVRVSAVEGGQGRVVGGHSAAITALAELSPGLLVSASRDHALRLTRLEAPAGASSEPFARAEGAFLSLASLTAERFVTGDATGAVSLWNVRNGLERRIAAHEGWVWSVACERAVAQRETDSAPPRIASASEDGSLAVWQAEGGQCSGRVPLRRGPIHAAAWLDAETIAAGAADGTISLHRASLGPSADLAELLAIRAHDGEVYAVCSAPSGFATAGEDGFVRRFDREGRLLAERDLGVFMRTIRWLAGDDFLAGGYDGAVRVVSLPFRRERE